VLRQAALGLFSNQVLDTARDDRDTLLRNFFGKR
jgi:hypothetical protein